MNSLMIIGIFTVVFVIVSYVLISMFINLFFKDNYTHKIMKNKTIHFPVVGMKERIKYITLFDITLLIKVSYKSDDKNINLYIKDITTNRETENILIKSDFTEDDEIGKSVVANTDDGSIEIPQTKLNKTKIELEITLKDTSKIPYKSK